jgi:outer membrane PBP1 activator LpoA protein
MAKMVGHLNGDSKPRQLTPAEAQHDIRQRLEEARLAGDRKTFDALTAALAHGEKKAAQAASLLKKRNTELEATQQTFAAEKKAQYLELKQAFKDAELHRLRVGGLTGDDAEAQYNLLSASSVEEAARAGSGYSPPREEILVGA